MAAREVWDVEGIGGRGEAGAGLGRQVGGGRRSEKWEDACEVGQGVEIGWRWAARGGVWVGATWAREGWPGWVGGGEMGSWSKAS